MKPAGVFRTSVAAVAGFACLCVASTAHSQIEAKRNAVMTAARMIEGRFQRYVEVTCPLATAGAHVDTRVFAAAVLPYGYLGIGDCTAKAGFSLPPFGVEGISMPGAQVIARLKVFELTGQMLVHLQVRNETTGRLVHDGLQRVSAPAVTTPVTMTSAPMTLENHNKYKAIVFIQPPREGTGLRSFVAEISELKWTFAP